MGSKAEESGNGWVVGAGAVEGADASGPTLDVLKHGSGDATVVASASTVGAAGCEAVDAFSCDAGAAEAERGVTTLASGWVACWSVCASSSPVLCVDSAGVWR